MKKITAALVAVALSLFASVTVFAVGDVTVSTTALNVNERESTTFTITATNCAGRVDITSDNPNVATVDTGTSTIWVDHNSAKPNASASESYTVTVRGVSGGNTAIKTTLTTVATYDDEELDGKVYTIPITVNGKSGSTPTPGNNGNTGGGYQPPAAERAANGDTTIGIMQTNLDPQTVAFEVPLYVTVAAVNGQTELRCPTNYGITNTSQEVDGAYFKLAVTRLTLQTVANHTWEIVDGTPTQNKQLALQIGGLSMPATNGAATGAVHIVDIKNKDNTFYNLTARKFTLIDKTGPLMIPVAGQVAGSTRGDVAAAPQFRLKYTVSPVTEDGALLGQIYVGDDSVAAGFGVWNEQTKQFDRLD